METRDRIIADLMNALDMIRRESDREDCRRVYIHGVAEAAIVNCNTNRERNADGYLVVKAASR